MAFEDYIEPLPEDRQRQYHLLRPHLEPVMEGLCDPDVEEIFVYGPNRIVYRGRSDRESDGPFYTAEDLDAAMRLLATFNDRRLGFDDGANPVLEGVLPCGSRISGALAGINVEASNLTIRKHGRSMMTTQELIDTGMVDEAGLETLRRILVDEDRSVLISGGTGAGKTTFLNALARYLDPSHRILVCEDTPEIKLSQPNVVRFRTHPNAGVTMMQLVDLCMRQTGDHILIGEIRAGAQTRNGMAPSPAYPFIMALNSGHGASMTTIHANSGIDALIKMVDYCHLSGMGAIPDRVFRQAVVSAFGAVVQIKRMGALRRVVSIDAVEGLDRELGFRLRALWQGIPAVG